MGDPTNRGLIMSWFINEHSGTSLFDASRQGNAGTVSGATWTPGKRGVALSLDGTDDIISRARLSGMTNWSVYIKYCPDSVSGKYPILDQGDILIYQNDDDIVWGLTDDTYCDRTSTAATVLTATTWVELLLTKQGSSYTLYVDGKASDTLTDSNTALTALTNLVIGRDSRTAFVYEAMTPAALTAYKALLTNASDDLQYSTGSASLNSAVVAECFSGLQGSIGLWIRRSEGNPTFTGKLFDIANTGSANRLFVDIDTSPNGTVRCFFRDKDDDDHTLAYVFAGLWDVGTWHHIVVTWDFPSNAMALYTDGVLRDDTPSGALSNDSFGALPATLDIGSAYNDTLALNGLIVTRILDRPLTAAEVTALYAAGAGHADSFVVTPDTKLLMLTSDDSTSVVYHHFGQKIQSISTVTLTTVDAVGSRWVAGDKVLVYDDDDPANAVYTSIDGTPSGSSITVTDSCATVSGTNKFITRNRVVDSAFESAGVANITCDANWAAAKDSTTVKFGTQSLELTAVSADDAEASTVASPVLTNGQDYFHRFWIYVDSLSDDLYFKIDGSGSIVDRQLNTGTDDMGTSYATGTWLMYEGVFAGDQDGAHALSYSVTGGGGGGNDAVILIDKMEVLPSLIVNGGME